MRAEIAGLQRELETTTIYVTHDQVEAMTMGDRVAVMRKGELQQMDEPQKLYSDPANLFVASFIGSPAMNIVEADLSRTNGAYTARIGDQELTVPQSVAVARPALASYDGRRIALGIRPEQLEDASLSRDGEGGSRLRGRVLLTESLGSELLAYVELEGKQVLTDDVIEGTAELEDVAVREGIEQQAQQQRTTFVGRFEAESEVRPDHIVDMAVDTTKLQLFDLETGLSIRGER
jgi:multiple sugar transport system ATP-binding protein